MFCPAGSRWETYANGQRGSDAARAHLVASRLESLAQSALVSVVIMASASLSNRPLMLTARLAGTGDREILLTWFREPSFSMEENVLATVSVAVEMEGRETPDIYMPRGGKTNN